MFARKFIYILFLVTMFSLNFYAQSGKLPADLSGNPANWCRGGLYTHQNTEFKIARIKGDNNFRSYFYKDSDDCPNGKNCRLNSYLIPGDEVVTSINFGKFTCVWYPPKKGFSTVGWIKTEDLLMRANKNESLNWVGEWRHAGNEISIKPQKQKGTFKIYGTAIWKGLGDNIHTGEIDFTAVPSNKEMSMGYQDSEFDCRVQMQLLGRFLLVADNKNCGGVNVSFDGIYQRK